MSSSSSSSAPPPKRLQTRGVDNSTREASREVSFRKPPSTPFSTPFKNRNQSIRRPDFHDKQTKKAIKTLKGLVNKQWYFFNVSPLFNMNYNEVSLKRYARRLKEKLMSRLPDESGTEYEVHYALSPNLQLNSIDHEAIEITVVKIPQSGNRSVAYNAILLSWGATKDLQPNDATFLPILLCYGLKGIIKQVHTEFQLVHDCFVHSFNMGDEDLRKLCAAFIHTFSYEENSIIRLKYNLPQKTKSGAIDISLPTVILSDLLKCVIQVPSHDVTDADVLAFWNEIHTHTYRSFGIDLTCCRLLNVTLPDVAFNQDAVKAKERRQFCVLLRYLMGLDSSPNTVAPSLHEVVYTV